MLLHRKQLQVDKSCNETPSLEPTATIILGVISVDHFTRVVVVVVVVVVSKGATRSSYSDQSVVLATAMEGGANPS